MLETYRENIKDLLIPMDEFKPFPKYEDRAGWEAMSEEYRAFMIQKGEEYLHYGWPTALASVYMDFVRNGNRVRYEDIIFEQRRLPLQHLVMAECCEGKGRFIDDIINGVWTTLDEATWVIPAHNIMVVPNGGHLALPDTENHENVFVDLFSAECGAVISWVYYLLGSRLGEEAPQVPVRMLGELQRRIFKPILLHDTFDWMGLHGQGVNNWNPWICSNVMTAAAFACPDEEQRANTFAKCLLCLEQFVKSYAPDGGCDEGPSYWRLAGGALFDCLDVLYDVTGGRADCMKEDLVRNMCAYIYKMHISGSFFVNYADAHANIYPDAFVIYRMGKRTGDENLVKMGVRSYHMNKKIGVVWNMDGCECMVYRAMKKALTSKQITEEPNGDYPNVRDVWFPGIQVMAARMEEGSNKGLYLSAKGGHNAENHNHNDVGTFVIYCDGQPVMIDIGTAVYDKKTFSAQRYEIPQIGSYYHNLPIVGGEGQSAGKTHAAKDVAYNCTDERVTFTQDISGAYPDTAGVNQWQREFTFDRANGTVTVTDDFTLNGKKEVQLVLMTAKEPTFAGGEMTVAVDAETAVTVSFDPALTFETSRFDTAHDDNLRGSWGEVGVYRTVFTLPGKLKAGSHAFTFRKK